MSAPDSTHVRMFENERDRHKDAAHRALTDVKEQVDLLLTRWDGQSPVIVSSAARHIFERAAEAYARAEAFDAVAGLSFLLTGSDVNE